MTFAVIGPHEYELPVNFEDFGASVRYGFSNTTSKIYEAKANYQPSILIKFAWVRFASSTPRGR